MSAETTHESRALLQRYLNIAKDYAKLKTLTRPKNDYLDRVHLLPDFNLRSVAQYGYSATTPQNRVAVTQHKSASSDLSKLLGNNYSSSTLLSSNGAGSGFYSGSTSTSLP